MKKIIFSFFITITSFTCFSQINLSGYGSFIRNLTPDNHATTYGGGIKFEFAKNETFTKFVGIAYDVPMYSTSEVEARAFDSWTDPSSQTVTVRYSRPMFRGEFGSNYYLVGDANNFKGFNWYLSIAAEAIYMQNKSTYSSYDKVNYTLGTTSGSDVNEDGSAKSTLYLYLMGGTGIEKNLGPGNIFLHGTIGLPVTSTSASSDFEEFTPLPLSINLGYKIPLGSRNDN